MIRYVSYSLWGNNPLYNVGIIKNAEQMKKIYPEWKMVVYYNDTVPKDTIDKLSELDVDCVNLTGLDISPAFWRFFVSDRPNCEYAVFRDADSRLSQREKLAVDEWIKSGKGLHVMRDHPYHGIPAGNDMLGILAGMWGIKGGLIPMIELISRFPKSKENKYGNDQTFLKTIYLSFGDDKVTHDEFFEKKPFPIPRENGRFVGERINVNDEPLTDDYKMVL